MRPRMTDGGPDYNWELYTSPVRGTSKVPETIERTFDPLSRIIVMGTVDDVLHVAVLASRRLFDLDIGDPHDLRLQ
jgi:hypothetical protein